MNCTALAYAIYYDEFEIVKQFLERTELWVDRTFGRNQTAFHFACERASANIVELLLADKRSDPLRKDDRGYNGLHLACENGKIENVKLLIEDGRFDLNTENVHNETAFVLACRRGHSKVVKMMLENNWVDPNHLNKKWYSNPLYTATFFEKPKIVKLLLQNLPEVSSDCWKESQNIEALVLACNRKKRHILSTMLLSGKFHPIHDKDQYLRTDKNPFASLLKEYNRDPITVCSRLRAERGHGGKIFVLTVLLCDDYFTIKKDSKPGSKKFFKIIQKLPLELQMKICKNIYGEPGEIYRSDDFCKKLKRILHHV